MIALLAIALMGQLPQPRLFLQPNSRGLAGAGVWTPANPVPLSLQCSGNPLQRNFAGQSLTVSRSGLAYCAKSDGTLVLASADTPRLEYAGVLVETPGANDMPQPRDCSTSAWTRSNVTCTSATGVDGVANAASRVTATANNGSAYQQITKASAPRASSLIIRRAVGTGAVNVTRNGGTTKTDISSSLSSTVWKRVRPACGTSNEPGAGYQSIPNCIEVGHMGGSVTNPSVGIQLAVSGDAVDIDFVQDENNPYPTSVIAQQLDGGWFRASERISGSPASLPTSQGEAMVDFSSEWQVPNGTGNGNWFFDTSHENEVGGNGLSMGNTSNDGHIYAFVSASPGLGFTTISTTIPGYPSYAGNLANMRITWGGGAGRAWWDGNVTGQNNSGIAVPGANTAFDVGNERGVAQLDGWVGRIRFTSGAYASFGGSVADIGIFGDNVAHCGSLSIPQRSTQTLQSLVGGWASEKYISNTAVDGYTIDDCKSIWDLSVTALLAEARHPHTVLLLQCGVNSLSSGRTSVGNKIKAMFNEATDAGIQWVPATLAPCSSCSAVNVATLVGINGDISNWAADAGVPLANTYAALVGPDAGLSPLYDYGDGVNLNAAGCAVMTQVWCAAGGCGQ